MPADRSVMRAEAAFDTPPLWRMSLSAWADRQAAHVLILPAVLILLAFSIFPLLASAYLALSRFSLAPGGYKIRFVGLGNFEKLLFGSQQYHFLGTFGRLSLLEYTIIAAIAAGCLIGLWRYARRGLTLVGLIGRLIAAIMVTALATLALLVLNAPGFPGSLAVTLFYAIGGVALQFLLGLGLALLCAQDIRGRNFFRVVFFIPLMVTPVGIAYAFRMLADMGKGPIAPLWQMFGLSEFSWAADP